MHEFLAVLITLALITFAVWWVWPRPQFGRSGQWPAVRRRHLKFYPTCAACGGTRSLEVHHLIPYHLAPELELDYGNLLTLCEHNKCHYRVGHRYSWTHYNPNASVDAYAELRAIAERKATL